MNEVRLSGIQVVRRSCPNAATSSALLSATPGERLRAAPGERPSMRISHGKGNPVDGEWYSFVLESGLSRKLFHVTNAQSAATATLKQIDDIV